MRSESTFMEYTKPGRVEVLQEFFVPVHNFKVHNITIRYVAKDDATTLNYAREDMFGLVVLMQHGLKEEEITESHSQERIKSVLIS